MNTKICPDCLSNYKKSTSGRKNKKLGILWGSGKWIHWVYHNQETRKCLKHHTQALVDSAKRRASKNNASSSWADKSKIKEIYKDAVLKSIEEKIKYEVDHVLPLKGKIVCGLHNEFNLQVITGSENRIKSNKF